MSGYLFLTAPLFKKVKRCRSLNFKEVSFFSFLRIGKISGIEANYTSLFKGLFLKARNVPLRGVYFILLQHVALFYITGFSVRFSNFVSLKVEPYGKKKIQRVVKRSVKVPLWSQEKEKSTGKDRNSVELNHYIDALRVKFYQIYQDLELEGKIISARAIVNRYQGKDETFKTLYTVFKEHNDNCRKLIGAGYADITVRRYDNFLKYLMELVKRDYKVDDMLLREVNGELVRDVFIFCVYTGLAFIDVYNLRPEHVLEDSNGNLWIVKPREKTNNICNIPLLSIPKQILEKYKDNLYCMDKGTLLPVPCNQKMNSYRKRLKSIFLYKSSTSTLVI